MRDDPRNKSHISESFASLSSLSSPSFTTASLDESIHSYRSAAIGSQNGRNFIDRRRFSQNWYGSPSWNTASNFACVNQLEQVLRADAENCRYPGHVGCHFQNVANLLSRDCARRLLVGDCKIGPATVRRAIADVPDAYARTISVFDSLPGNNKIERRMAIRCQMPQTLHPRIGDEIASVTPPPSHVSRGQSHLSYSIM